MASDSFSTKLCNPFSEDIFPDGDPATASSLTLHHDAEERLEELLAEAAQQPPGAVRHGNGRVILLKAPRAGYGKSHLLSRLQIANPLAFFVVPLEFDPGETLSWKSLLDQVFQILHQPGNAGAPAPLDLVARRTFAMANAGMIRAGKIPCGEPETAAVSLEQRFAELFDFTNPEQEVARWFQENFERLLPVSSSLVSEETGLSEASALPGSGHCVVMPREGRASMPHDCPLCYGPSNNRIRPLAHPLPEECAFFKPPRKVMPFTKRSSANSAASPPPRARWWCYWTTWTASTAAVIRCCVWRIF